MDLGDEKALIWASVVDNRALYAWQRIVEAWWSWVKVGILAATAEGLAYWCGVGDTSLVCHPLKKPYGAQGVPIFIIETNQALKSVKLLFFRSYRVSLCVWLVIFRTILITWQPNFDH